MAETSRRLRAVELPPVRAPETAADLTPRRALDGMRGDLAHCPLPELVQLLHQLRKDGHLVLERDHPPQAATFYFAEGQLVDAYAPPLEGVDCVHAVLAWPGGRFLFLDEAPSTRRTITTDLRSLLLEGLRLIDELRAHLAVLPPLSAVLHRTWDAEALAGASLSAEAWRLLDRIDGQTPLADLLGLSMARQCRAGHALASLAEAHLISDQLPVLPLHEIILDQAPGGAPESLAADAVALLAACDGERSLAAGADLTGSDQHRLLLALQALVDARAVVAVVGEMALRRLVLMDLYDP